ncbi:hypothetical protein [Paenibacillus cremeus]|uniref:Uncharacterized protein n=1 Tax=Paenibacillus cremeus TaxID=2163881 RepID=A0A559KFT6_9BACL|nr:hypothetical protein [Paenibacillus cremeus]TVY10993.1 hypothetical protein FPZ49_05850 [Paenibacillus cremeus]
MNHCGTIYGVSLETLQEQAKLLLEINGYYDQLIGMAPDQEQSDLLKRLITENTVNINRIRQLYLAISCNELQIPPVKPPHVTDYLEGLSKVRSLEVDILPKFVKMYLGAPNIYYTNEFTSIRSIIAFLAATPFLHGSLLQYLITKNLFPNGGENRYDPMRQNAGNYSRTNH